MTKRSPEERREFHEARRTKAEASGKLYRAKEEAYRAGGKIDKAAKAATTAKDFELNAATHRRAIEDLDADAPRQHRIREEAARVATVKAQDLAKAQAKAEQEALDRLRRDPLRIYMEAMRHAEELDGEEERWARKARAYREAGDQNAAERATKVALERAGFAVEWRQEAQEAVTESGRDLARERAVAVKAQERHSRADAKERARLEDLKVESDTRTAAGSRELVVGGIRKGRIVSMATYETLLARPQDRSKARLEAMHDFDMLCATAEAGLIPEPKFEHESGSGRGPGALVMEKRAAGLEELSDLREAIGPGNVEFLHRRICDKAKLSALARDGYGTEKTVAVLFLAALDSMVVFFKTRNTMAARLAGMSIAQAPPENSPRSQASAARR